MTFPRRPLAALCLCLCLVLPAAATTRAPAAAVRPTPAAAPNADPALAAEAVAAPAPVVLPRIALETSLGRIVLELYPHQAPATVANFLDYAARGHYNGTIFHRAIQGVLVQGGAFTVDMQPKPERAPVGNEAGNGLRNTRGTIAAARRPSDRASAGAQFFINLRDNPAFDRRADAPDEATGYCVFGRVIDGLDIADRIAALPSTARAPLAADVPVVAVVIERTDLLPATPAVPAARPTPAAPSTP